MPTWYQVFSTLKWESFIFKTVLIRPKLIFLLVIKQIYNHKIFARIKNN